MPRTDNKRAKQGRPKNPKPLLFQEQFTPNMPAAQQNVFIKPGPEIIDQPSRTSYGNMTPGPSGELDVLKGIVGGFNKGVDSYNRVHQDRVRRDRAKADKIFNQEYVKVTNIDGSTDMIKKGGQQHNQYLAEYEEEQKKANADKNYTPSFSLADGTDVSSFEHKRERLQGLLGDMTKEGRQYTKTKLNSAGKVHNRNLDQQSANQLRIDLANAGTELKREKILDLAESNGYVENGDEWTMIQVERAKIASRQSDAARQMALSQFEKEWRIEFNGKDSTEARKLGREFITNKAIDNKIFDNILDVPTKNEDGTDLTPVEITEARRLAYDNAVDLQTKIETMADDFELSQSDEERKHRLFLEQQDDKDWEDTWNGWDDTQKLQSLGTWESRLIKSRDREGLSSDDEFMELKKIELLGDMLQRLAGDSSGNTTLQMARSLNIDGPENYNGKDLAELIARRMADKFGLTARLDNDNVHTRPAIDKAEDKFVTDISNEESMLRTFITAHGNLNAYELAAVKEEIATLDSRKDAYQNADEKGKVQILSDLGFLGKPTDMDGQIGRILDSPAWADVYEGLGELKHQAYEASWQVATDENTKSLLQDPSKKALSYTSWLASSGYDPSYIDSRLTSIAKDTDFLVDFVEVPTTRLEQMTERLKDKGYTPEEISELTTKLSEQLDEDKRKFEQYSDSSLTKVRQAEAARIKQQQKQSAREQAVANASRNGIDLMAVNLNPDTDTDVVHLEAYTKVAINAYQNLFNGMSVRNLPSAFYDVSTPGGQIINGIMTSEGLQGALESLREGDTQAVGEWITGLIENDTFKDQDVQAVGEVLQILDYNTYLSPNGFTVKNYKSPIARKLQAAMLGQLVNLEGTTYTLDNPDLFGTPQEFTFNIKGDSNLKEKITSEAMSVFGELNMQNPGEGDREMQRFFLEMIESYHIAQEIQKVGDSVEDEAERTQRMLAIDSGTFVRSPEFVEVATEFGLTAEFARGIQVSAMILGGNFDETTLARLEPKSRKLVEDAVNLFLEPNNGSVFSGDQNYAASERNFRNYFQSIMVEIREQGGKISYADQLRVLFKYATGTGLNGKTILEGRYQEKSFTDEKIVEVLQAYVPADMAENGDAEEMSKFIFHALNDNQTLEGINAFTLMHVLQRMPNPPFVVGAPDVDALFYMALKPYELPNEMRYESMLGAVGPFMPRGYTKASEFGGNIVYGADDAFFSSSIHDEHGVNFVRSYVQQHQHHDNVGGLTGDQMEEANKRADILGEEISARDLNGHPTDLLTATVASEMILAEVSGRESPMLSNLFEGLPQDLIPENYLDLVSIGEVIYVASAYGDTTATGNMTFKMKNGERFASIPNINPFGEINPNQQHIELGGQVRIITAGDMQQGSPGASYIYTNNQALPIQLGEVGALIQDTKRSPTDSPQLGLGRHGFSVPFAGMSEEDQIESLRRLEDNQNNMILESLLKFGYVSIDKKTGIVDMNTTAVPAKDLAATGVSIGTIDPDHLVSLDVALAMIQQPLELKKEYLEFLLAKNQGDDMTAFLEQKGMSRVSGLPRRVSLGEELTGERLGTTRTEFIDITGYAGGMSTPKRTYRLPYEYQPIQTISEFDPTFKLDEKGQIEPGTYVEGGQREGYVYTGGAERQIEGLVRIGTARIGNLFSKDNVYDKALERGRARMRQQPTRYLRDKSQYRITPANVLDLRFKQVDNNGNPLHRPGVTSPAKSPFGRMGIEEMRELLEQEEQRKGTVALLSERQA